MAGFAMSDIPTNFPPPKLPTGKRSAVAPSPRSALSVGVGSFCREGWITRAGKFLPCESSWLHGHVASLALGGANAEYRAECMGWLRISTYGESCTKRLSQRQRDTYFDWAEAMGFDYAETVATLEDM